MSNRFVTKDLNGERTGEETASCSPDTAIPGRNRPVVGLTATPTPKAPNPYTIPNDRPDVNNSQTIFRRLQCARLYIPGYRQQGIVNFEKVLIALKNNPTIPIELFSESELNEGTYETFLAEPADFPR